MKKLVIKSISVAMLLGAIAISPSAIAQGKVKAPHKEKAQTKNPELKAERDSFKKDLNLTDDQHVKFKAIKKDVKGKMEALKSQRATMEKGAFRDQVKAIRKDEADRIKAILSPEQFAKWEKMREQMKEENADARKNHK